MNNDQPDPAAADENNDPRLELIQQVLGIDALNVIPRRANPRMRERMIYDLHRAAQAQAQVGENQNNPRELIRNVLGEEVIDIINGINDVRQREEAFTAIHNVIQNHRWNERNPEETQEERERLLEDLRARQNLMRVRQEFGDDAIRAMLRGTGDILAGDRIIAAPRAFDNTVARLQEILAQPDQMANLQRQIQEGRRPDEIAAELGINIPPPAPPPLLPLGLFGNVRRAQISSLRISASEGDNNQAKLKQQLEEATALDSVWASTSLQLERAPSLSSAVARWMPDCDIKFWDNLESEAREKDSYSAKALEGLDEKTAKMQRTEHANALKCFAIAAVRRTLKQALDEPAEVTKNISASTVKLCTDMEKDSILRQKIFDQATEAIGGCGSRIDVAFNRLVRIHGRHKLTKDSINMDDYNLLVLLDKAFNTETLETIEMPFSQALANVHAKQIFEKLVNDKLPLLTTHTHLPAFERQSEGFYKPIADAAVSAIQVLSKGKGDKEKAIDILLSHLPSPENNTALLRKTLQTSEESLLKEDLWKDRLFNNHKDIFLANTTQRNTLETQIKDLVSDEPYPPEKQDYSDKNKYDEEYKSYRVKNEAWEKEVQAVQEPLNKLPTTEILLEEITRQYREFKNQLEHQLTQHSGNTWLLQAGKNDNPPRIDDAFIRMELKVVRDNPVITEIDLSRCSEKNKPRIWQTMQLEGFATRGYTPTAEEKKELIKEGKRKASGTPPETSEMKKVKPDRPVLTEIENEIVDNRWGHNHEVSSELPSVPVDLYPLHVAKDKSGILFEERPLNSTQPGVAKKYTEQQLKEDLHRTQGQIDQIPRMLRGNQNGKAERKMVVSQQSLGQGKGSTQAPGVAKEKGRGGRD